MGKNPPANAGNRRDEGLLSGSGKSPEGGHGNPLQNSCLKNPMERGAWQAAVHRITESDTTGQLSTYTHARSPVSNSPKGTKFPLLEKAKIYIYLIEEFSRNK